VTEQTRGGLARATIQILQITRCSTGTIRQIRVTPNMGGRGGSLCSSTIAFCTDLQQCVQDPPNATAFAFSKRRAHRNCEAPVTKPSTLNPKLEVYVMFAV
jgi:hypothetical protein